MKGTVTLNRREQGRVRVLFEVAEGRMTVGEAAESMQLSVRHTRRMLAAFRKEGAKAIAHGNRGRQPRHTVSQEVRAQAVELAKTTYRNCNDSHLAEKLNEEHGIRLSRSSVRRIRRDAGLGSPRARRPPQHRVRRKRRDQAGHLVQVDGSDHHWFGPDQPRVVLMAAIDDATNDVVAAHFRGQEDSQGYLQLLADMVTSCGRPVALYHDKHQIFISPEPATVDEQLAGTPALTQVGRALAELEINPIPAGSPQAKGRIERLFGTFQDRLCVELELAGITSIDDANAFLRDFIPQFNQRFRRQAAVPGSAFAPLPAGVNLAGICCFKYQRIVANDNTVQFANRRIQLLPGPIRISYAKATVEVQERLDGTVVVVYQGEEIGSQPAPADLPVLRARSGPRTPPSAVSMQDDQSPAMAEPLASPGREQLAAWSPRPPTPVSTRSTPAKNHPWRQGLKRRATQS